MTYACQSWTQTKVQLKKLDSAYTKLLRHLVRGGFSTGQEQEYTTKSGTSGTFRKLRMSNDTIHDITKAEKLSDFIIRQQTAWVGHIARHKDEGLLKELCFETGKGKKKGPATTTYKQVIKRVNDTGLDKFEDYERLVLQKFVDREI